MSTTMASTDTEGADWLHSWWSSLHFAALSVVRAPSLLRDNVANLCSIVGTKFVLSTVIIYGVQQGLSSSWFSQARDYFFKDVLMLEPAAAQVFVAIAQVPWSIKPIYGMASDFVPIFGYHRIPYICIAGVLSTTCFALLASLGSAGELSARLAVLLLFGANVSVASPDVMVDSMVAEHTKSHPRASTDLQSLLWGSLSLCAVAGFLSSGYLISTIGPVRLFGVLMFVGVLVFLPGALNWLGEKPNRVVTLGATASASHSSKGGGQDPDSSSCSSTSSSSHGGTATQAPASAVAMARLGLSKAPVYSTLDRSSDSTLGAGVDATETISALHGKGAVLGRGRGDVEMLDGYYDGGGGGADAAGPHSSGTHVRSFLCGCVQVDMDFVAEYRDVLMLATIISCLALFVGAVALMFDDFHVRLITVLCVAISVVVLVIFMTRQKYSLIGTTGLFFFSVTALAPDTDTAMFYWYTDYEGGPQFTPRFVGYISALSFGAMFVGILVYNRFLSSWPFRRTFYYFITLAALLGIPDITLIMRWNLALGISDEWFVFGEAAIAPILRRCTAMPLYIIAAKVCPEGAEATVFAMLTALGNFGAAVSSYVGASLLIVFNIDSSNYDNFVWLIMVKMCFRLCTLLLIPLLVPHGCPLDAVVSFDPAEVRPATDSSAHGDGMDTSSSQHHPYPHPPADRGSPSSAVIDESSRSTHQMLPKAADAGVPLSSSSNDRSASPGPGKLGTGGGSTSSGNGGGVRNASPGAPSSPQRPALHDVYMMKTSSQDDMQPPGSSSSATKVDTSGFFQHIELNSSKR